MLNDREKLQTVYKVANNVLYFDDSSDYRSVLWEILEIVDPEIFINDADPKLKLIE